MEWDQIAEKWGRMAHRMRNDTRAGGALIGATRIDGPSGIAWGQAAAPFARNDEPPRTIPAETSPMDRSLKSGQ